MSFQDRFRERATFMGREGIIGIIENQGGLPIQKTFPQSENPTTARLSSQILPTLPSHRSLARYQPLVDSQAGKFTARGEIQTFTQAQRLKNKAISIDIKSEILSTRNDENTISALSRIEQLIRDQASQNKTQNTHFAKAKSSKSLLTAKVQITNRNPKRTPKSRLNYENESSPSNNYSASFDTGNIYNIPSSSHIHTPKTLTSNNLFKLPVNTNQVDGHIRPKLSHSITPLHRGNGFDFPTDLPPNVSSNSKFLTLSPEQLLLSSQLLNFRPSNQRASISFRKNPASQDETAATIITCNQGDDSNKLDNKVGYLPRIKLRQNTTLSTINGQFDHKDCVQNEPSEETPLRRVRRKFTIL